MDDVYMREIGVTVRVGSRTLGNGLDICDYKMNESRLTEHIGSGSMEGWAYKNKL